MKRLAAVGLALLLTGCGAGSSEVVDGMRAPTGLAPGVTLFFVDADQRLRPQPRETGRLGTVVEALALLLTGPGADPDLHTEISARGETRVVVETSADRITVRLPLTGADLTDLGVDQVVCTALGVHVQGGGSASTTVLVVFTLPGTEPNPPRRCPVIPPG
ncbi:hypothetical protein [Umezawaea sp.]|uniref:hypothetical protein n=1 Tax=Umezawaea sp. TaxID=1955258 RepID=UPI002ED580A5